MSKDEIKVEILQVLDSLSDKALQELLVFLKQINSKNSPGIFDISAINQILEEDNGLLEKLMNQAEMLVGGPNPLLLQ